MANATPALDLLSAYQALEPALEALVNVCNNFDEPSNWSETIAAEAALEGLHRARRAAIASVAGGPVNG